MIDIGNKAVATGREITEIDIGRRQDGEGLRRNQDVIERNVKLGAIVEDRSTGTGKDRCRRMRCIERNPEQAGRADVQCRQVELRTGRQGCRAGADIQGHGSRTVHLAEECGCSRHGETVCARAEIDIAADVAAVFDDHVVAGTQQDIADDKRRRYGQVGGTVGRGGVGLRQGEADRVGVRIDGNRAMQQGLRDPIGIVVAGGDRRTDDVLVGNRPQGIRLIADGRSVTCRPIGTGVEAAAHSDIDCREICGRVDVDAIGGLVRHSGIGR